MNEIQNKIQKIRGALNAVYIDRMDVIDGLLIALVAREHMLMLGPPGVAKSAMATAVTGAIDGGRCFTTLLTRTTAPEELWGPIDLVAFDHGKLQRQTENFLPTAHLAFLDEVWRGSSAILNGLLTAINEREWEDNGTRLPLPLRTVVGASNSLPEAGDLDALYDRFALRFVVGRLTRKADKRRLLKQNGVNPSISQRLTLDELDQAHREAMALPVPDELLDAMLDVWDELVEKGYDVSERRWKQILHLMRAKAYIEGLDTVDAEQIEVIADSAWNRPEERTEILQVILNKAAPSVARAVEILDAAKASARKVPSYTGSNDVQVATAVTEVKRAIKELNADLQEVIAKAQPHEKPRLTKYSQAMDKLRDGITKKMTAVITA